MSTFKTSTRYNKSNWNNFTRSKNRVPIKSRPMPVKRVEKQQEQQEQQDEAVDKALEEARRISRIAADASRTLANPNISPILKKKEIIKLTKELKQSVTLLDKIRDWFRNFTRRIRNKFNNFGRGVRKLFTRGKKKTMTWQNEVDGEPLLSRRTYNENNTPNTLKCSKLEERTNYTEKEKSIRSKVVVLLNKINYDTYGRKYLKDKCAKKDFFNRTVAKFVDYLTDNDPIIIKNVLRNFDINSEEAVNKVISDWNIFTSDECGKEFIRILFFKSLDRSYNTSQYSKASENQMENILALPDTVITSIIQFICNIEDNGAVENYTLQDGKLFGVKEEHVARESMGFTKRCREKLINNSDISEERKIELMTNSKNRE